MSRDLMKEAGHTKAVVVVADSLITDPAITQIPPPKVEIKSRRMSFLEIIRSTPTGDRLLKDEQVDELRGIPWIHYALTREIEFIDPRDLHFPEQNDHGAHVAGIIGGHSAWFGSSEPVEIFAVDVFSSPVHRLTKNFQEMLENLYNFPHSNYIVNFSLEVPPTRGIIRAAEALREDRNASLVFAAGNSGRSLSGWEGASQTKGALIVGAFGPWGGVAEFSNYGRLSIMAPGVEIFSSLNPDSETGMPRHEFYSGTSMAAPMVTGALANLRAIFPQEEAELLEKILLESAWDLESDSVHKQFGKGLLNTYKATRIALDLARRSRMSVTPLSHYLSDLEEFDTTRMARKARLAQYQVPKSSEAYRRLVYQEVLLGGDITQFEKLSEFYGENFNLYAEGLRFLSYNRASECFEDDEVEALSQHAMGLQNSLLDYQPSNYGVLMSLRQPQIVQHLKETKRIFHPALYEPGLLAKSSCE
jgi:hypothetical protein